MYTEIFGGAPAYSLGLGGHGLAGLSDSAYDARDYIRSQWARFEALGPKVIDLQHRAAVAAYNATQRGDTESAALARESIYRLRDLNIKHGEAVDLANTYREFLFGSGLGAVPVALVAVTGLALLVVWYFRAFEAEARRLDMIEAGTLTPEQAVALSANVGAAPVAIAAAGVSVIKWGLLAAAAYVAFTAYQGARPRARKAKRNPPLVVFDSNPPEVFGEEVYELRYRHADDGGNWVHEFGPGVQMTAYPDGHVGLSHRSGRPVWKDF